ncbi:hypothetical protein HDU87_000140 [Geranomyces variabilis]|uniref:Fe2OG dioxygenase domain-containing protein n=1 Tax=Geranomyces variabilis TaxID=109894 RepID=A0AAD5XU43_9FUNG|nr:hypothetical protein HDU87_000140 [Geranomyces variabilis]
MTIPLVDFAPYRTGTDADRKSVAVAIDDAFCSAGFVYLANHGISPDRVAQCFEWSARFFALPDEVKQIAPHPPGFTHHRGYSGCGKEKVTQMMFEQSDLARARAAAPDVKESFESGNPIDNAQPNIWLPEKELPGFKDFMENFFEDCKHLIHEILGALSLALSLPESLALPATHAQSLFQLRLLHYPAISRSLLTSGSRTRISAHSDFGTLTLLFQDEVGGLEVEDPDPLKKGTFHPVPPRPGTVIVNIADLMERWSNGRWKSTVHRVGPPPPASGGGGDPTTVVPARYSIPFFATADPQTVISALPGTYDSQNPKRWDSVTAAEYVQMRMSALY